ncbi:MAG TPA: DNA methyltransferase [Chitinophagaceae bacterium]
MSKKTIAELENKIHPKVRLNAICPYFTMFPLSFPYKTLQSAAKTDLVYDPFCGRGTTNYAARLLGITSYGVDSNPVAFAVAQAKLINANPKSITKRCTDVLQNTRISSIPAGDFWELAYHPTTLVDICKLRKYFINKESLDKIDIALRAIILGTLHGPKMKSQASYLSNQMPRTFATKPDYSITYWQKNNMLPDEVNLLQLVTRKSQYVFNKQLPEQTDGRIILGDSRTVKRVTNHRFNWVITSPPYYGMSTYEQDQWLRNWFLGGPSKVKYSNTAQLKHGSEKSFVEDLSKVWSNAARKSNPNAKLIIRFGALPSKSDKTPSELIKDSLNLSDCGWKLTTIRTAGEPVDSKRQANQFKNKTGKYIEEIDAFATLNI